MSAGLNALRSGTVGEVQGLAHGETGGQVLKTGGFAAGTTGLLEGAGNVIEAFATKVENIAGTKIPVRPSSESRRDAMRIAKSLRSSERLPPVWTFRYWNSTS